MTTRRPHHRAGLGLLGAGVLALGLGAAPAGAHISGDRSEVPAGAYTQVTFTVPHGCDESPTRALAFQIPEGILNAAPQVHPGWDVETTMAPLEDAVAGGHGDEQTERVSEITWTAQPGNELPPPFRDAFTIGFQAPDTPGEDLAFKVVQTCVEGEVAWIEEPVEGEDEPEHPAIVVAVGEAEGDGHGGGAESPDDDHAEEAGAEATAATEPVAARTDGDDGSSDALGIGGLVLGALGLAAGGVALLRTRATP